MKVLITGCAGFLGSHLSESFLNQNVPVVGIDSMDASYDQQLKRQNLIEVEKISEKQNTEFCFYAVDVRHQGELEQVFSEHHDVGAVFHLVGTESGHLRGNFHTVLDNHVKGFVSLCEVLAKGRQDLPLVVGSSYEVYGNTEPAHSEQVTVKPVSSSGLSAKLVETMADHFSSLFGLRVLCLRFFSVYGSRLNPHNEWARLLQMQRENANLSWFGEASDSRDLVHVADAVNACHLAQKWLQNAGGAECHSVNIGTGKATSVGDFVTWLKNATEQACDIQYLPREKSHMLHSLADTKKAKEMLGFTHQTKWQEGFKPLVQKEVL